MRYIAYTTKGLEKIAENEIKENLDAEILEVDDKRVVFETAALFNDLIELKTVDDLGLLIKTSVNIISIEDIVKLIDSLNLDVIKHTLTAFRKIENNDFSITASFAKAKNVSPHEVILEVGKRVSEKYNWNFTEFDHTNFDIRIFIDQKTSYISIRLTKESLHRRTYKTDSQLGSLRSTVAAAMVLMATQRKKNLKIVDNFCGSGTILLEALATENDVYGGDINPESVSTARINLKKLLPITEERIKTLDARQTKWQTSFFDCAISNLPWDKQIKVKSITILYEGTIKEYARIVKKNGAICLLLTKPELMIKYAKKYISDSIIETRKIGLLGQNPTIILITRSD